METERISKWFEHFADRECVGSSELYDYLSRQIAKDEELVQLASYAREGQPVPNLFLGAVHYLLLGGKDHLLKYYYQSMTDNPKNIEESFPHFKDFCITHKEEIILLLQQKIVQTNEVRRCAYLYPAFCYIYEKTKKPLAFIEIGTSAGLQLIWDKYAYSYGKEEVFGHKESDVHIHAEIIGENKPQFLQESPPVTARIGLDLHINDVKKAHDSLWLRALIWPEHTERVILFDQAVQKLRKEEVTLIEGDGVGLLSKIVKTISIDSTLCIYHTHVANQMPLEVKNLLLENIQKIGKERDIFHLHNNICDTKLRLDSIVSGVESSELVAETDGHGRWFKWELVSVNS
ncbi:DUF2332 domain-containing protein [Priestia taiwanensis]|uniref:DUF2332 domain-containing protein n=1 Tax=Priestia taiwanensis TaxID=1347902 RepID=A0A917AMH1_9BACI|nr:DUF2332 domain-containing protein [Priestia taiwanensis]MBM7362406.1 hypothetical protein [Priestia taiwanensis]GGE62002.1 hypothetical protein GCM10007140_10300 [Priestia taiwanensis]